MGKPSRDKGKRGEREIAGLLRDYGYDARRGVQYHGGADSPDVVGLPGVHIEVKRTETLSLYPAMEQAKHDAAQDEMPVVMHRRNNCEWLCVMRLDDFMSCIKATTERRAGIRHKHK